MVETRWHDPVAPTVIHVSQLPLAAWVFGVLIYEMSFRDGPSNGLGGRERDPWLRRENERFSDTLSAQGCKGIVEY
jgi:hypothetical protein